MILVVTKLSILTQPNVAISGMISKKNINFTLYPTHRRVSRGNLVLIHSVPHFPPNSRGIACLMGIEPTTNRVYAFLRHGRPQNILKNIFLF